MAEGEGTQTNKFLSNYYALQLEMKDFSNCFLDSVYKDGARCFICRKGRGNNKAKLPFHKALIPCNVLLLRALILLFIKVQFQYNVSHLRGRKKVMVNLLVTFLK